MKRSWRISRSRSELGPAAFPGSAPLAHAVPGAGPEAPSPCDEGAQPENSHLAGPAENNGGQRGRHFRLPFSFCITREGWGFILAVLLLLLAALNTGNNLLILILAMMLSVILTSGIFARNSLRSVTVSLQVPESVYVGEPVSLKVSVRNQKRFLHALSVTVEDLALVRARSLLSRIARKTIGRKAPGGAPDLSVLRHPAYFPWIPPRSMRSEVIAQFFPKRGLYRLEGFRISTRFPFGFFIRGELIPAEGCVWVYPSVHEVSSDLHLLPFLPGRMESSRVGHGESLYAIRAYREGESARHVDWKATAKTGSLMAREFARDEENNFCLLLDTLLARGAAEHAAEQFERAVSLAASLARHFAEEGAEFELLTPRIRIPRGIGATHLARVLRALAVVRHETAEDDASPDLRAELAGILEPRELQHVLSDKLFKIILTSKPRGSVPPAAWRSSHVIYFDEL